ncbi:Type I restriction-modification system methyltransferase subunit-like protein [Haloarcula japonica DSM 6131]|uniref:Type I restriction-modification system methyltransferase subunit-like protein n=1 Tax=Haloarcula japonica (strain ATCC 49778 / DSM 6131 / JCM 7785 / NBRC 101032 / NCIMB 13157 / TR-1) TaxID=1227453 RepID=M0L5R4_HALJT|nr:Type I restriction-modification system methyltransferase subunit-like protein [Haloarcula japonica DSM 6131]
MASPQLDVNEILETLEQIRQRGHSAHTVFRDWVTLMFSHCRAETTHTWRSSTTTASAAIWTIPKETVG